MAALHPDARKALIFEILQALEPFSGVAFEPLGHRLAEMLANLPLLHRGQNAKGNPQGYAVDSYTYEGDVAAQYGTEVGYFADLKKPKQDYEHVRSLLPNAKRVFLLSTRAETAKEGTAVTAWRAGLAASDGVDVQVYDAKRLSEFIVDVVLGDERLLDRIVDLLEPLRRLRELYAASNSLPEPSAGAIARPPLEDDIIKLLDEHGVVLLAGMSGMGKSAVAVSVANRIRSSFAWPIWTSELALRSVADLGAIDVTRNGLSVNILAMLRTRSCLLILDDVQSKGSLEELVEEVRVNLGAEARVIVTSQDALSLPYTVVVPPMDNREARELLESGVDRCPDVILDAILPIVGGHPLALRLLNGLARGGASWSEVAADTARVADLHVHERTARLVDVIIGERLKLLRKPLSAFIWCESPRLHAGLLRALVGFNAIQSLTRFGFVAADQPDTLRLHDLVWASIKAFDPPLLPQSSEEFALATDNYVRELAESESRTMVVNHLARVHERLFHRLVTSGEWLPGHLYARLHYRGYGSAAVSSLPDASVVASEAAGAGNPFLVRVASELAEAVVYLSAKQNSSDGESEALLQPFYSLLGSRVVDDASKLFVRHHKAKALKRLGRYADAVSELEGIIASCAAGTAPAVVRLLLARTLTELPYELRTQNSRERSGELLVELLDQAHQHGIDVVSVSVTLAAAELLRRQAAGLDVRALLPKYASMLEPLIIDAAKRGLSQGPLTFAALAAAWREIDGPAFLRIFERLPLPSVAAEHSEAAAWGEILTAAAAHHPSRRCEFLELALAFFGRSSSGYAKTHAANVLILLGRGGEAVALLAELLTENLRDRDRAWANRRLSEAYASIGMFGDAVEAASRALSELPPGDRYSEDFAEFLKQVSECANR